MLGGSRTRRSEPPFAELADRINPAVSCWISIFQRFRPSAFGPLPQRINAYLVRWIRQRCKRLAAKRRPSPNCGRSSSDTRA
ncbi:group II intron maturase-specific domain-containing protein [Streptomyces sp. NBC_00987]|uniref:group II intron maturase-specific domain-containing protein n=1 Tax=unclassified Streptomyces TaxID=2593676 RepID=UPI0038650BA3